jgi:hypothetical protein
MFLHKYFKYKVRSILSWLMGFKAFLILLKFLQSINLKKKQHEYKLYILVINLILKN